MMSTNVRGAATLEDNKRFGLIRDSPRSSQASTPRVGTPASMASPRWRAPPQHVQYREAPTPPSTPRSVREAAFIMNSLAGNFPKFYSPYDLQRFSPPKPPEKKTIGVQVSPRGEAVRAAPVRVSEAELRNAQMQIVNKLLARYGQAGPSGAMRRAFTTWDADRTGTISREELEDGLRLNNVVITRPVLDKLFSMIDYDGSGEFSYQEFMRVFTAPDIMNMEKPKTEVVERGADTQSTEDKARKKREYIAKKQGMSVEQYCEYYGITEKEMDSTAAV